ncbi:hypothetical protein MHU86_22183 [Fragilaria crotonensis]|nr:hypothetical protein MHU86_22183 [Fragilaria crotonensis]
MISAFQSREFGFGLDTTESDLSEVNRRRQGVKYRDTQAAMDTRKTEYKEPLTTSPFIREFEYGQNADGYWTYQHMVLQLEDCVDILNVKYPQYDFLFLFDHSCGHDRQREDGLNVEKMSRSFGGQRRENARDNDKAKSRISRSTLTKTASWRHAINGVQSIGSRSFWMTEAQREETRHDRILEEENARVHEGRAA